MKKLVLSLLLASVATSSLATVHNSPINVCLIGKGLIAGLKMQLSYPGLNGIYSGVIDKGVKTCMHPYDWNGAPGIFDMFAVVPGIGVSDVFIQCTPGLTIRNGIKNAPLKEIDYTLKETGQVFDPVTCAVRVA